MKLELKNLTYDSLKYEDINEQIQKAVEEIKKYLKNKYLISDSTDIDSMTCYIRLKEKEHLIEESYISRYFCNSKLHSNLDILHLYIYYCFNCKERKQSIRDFCLLYNLRYQNVLLYLKMHEKKLNIEKLKSEYKENEEYREGLNEAVYYYINPSEIPEPDIEVCNICKQESEKPDLFLLDNKYYCEYCLIEALATKGIIGLEQTDEGRKVLY